MNKFMTFVATTDDKRARVFYEDVLGLKFIADDGFALLFESGGITMRLQRVKELVPQNFTVLGWQVSDIETEIGMLTKKGVTFEIFEGFGQDDTGVMNFPNGDKVAWFKDPDGNMLSLAEIV